MISLTLDTDKIKFFGQFRNPYQKSFQFRLNRGTDRSLMKSFLLIFSLFLISSVATQDVRIPENLLEVTTIHQNVSDVDYEDVITTETVEDVEDTPPPDSLVDTRRPNIVLPIRPCQPSVIPPQVIPPFYPRPPQHQPCDVIQPTPPEFYPPEEIQTSSPIVDETYVPAEKEESRLCPIGSVQNGSVCIDVYSNDCPQGYTRKNDRCVLSRTSCPLNFEWNGRSCVQRRICPINHVWRNERCELPVPECPIGWTFNGVSCQIDNIQCPPGSVVRGNECVDESFTCPMGFIEENDDCVKPQPICPQGYELNEFSGFCVQENLKCPPGSQRVNDGCKTIVVRCPSGTYQHGNQCYNIATPRNPTVPTRRPSVTVPTRRPPSVPVPLTCPESYTLYNNYCYRCPLSYNLCNDQCVRGTGCENIPPQDPRPDSPAYPYRCPPDYNLCNNQCITGTGCGNAPSPIYPNNQYKSPVINVNLYSRNFGSSGGDRHIVHHVEPVNNTIVNINNVTHPITINNVNENNFYIYQDTQCADGSIRTVVVKNNETFNGCVDANPDVNSNRDTDIPDKIKDVDNDEEGNGEQEKCCEIVTPRQCKKKNEGEWTCSHKRYRYCGNFCIADRLYLKPPSTTYNNNVLTIAPSRPENASPPCFGRNCPAFGLLEILIS